ncbi:MAG: hypothetical protein AB3A66_27780 (plasmid) [Nodularia sp. CChRGM 3473]
MKQHKYRVMFWHDKGLVGNFYDLPHIPRIGEQVYLKSDKYRVMNVILTPEENDVTDIDITVEPV